VIVAQLGVDGHRTDPLTHLAFDLQGFVKAFTRILPLAPRIVALGGGGYDVRNVARGWTAAWAALNGVALADELPASYARDLEHYEFASNTLWDEPATALPEDIQRAVCDYVDRQVDAVQTTIFPFHRL